jgi:DMSO/TMAO reductase YedYZ molybdopterin-dependent catalytic subunit
VRLTPTPRLVDATLLLGLGLALATGLWSLLASAAEWWVVATHGVVGLTLVVLLAWKLRRVAPDIPDGARSPSVWLSLLLTALAVAVLATGLLWTAGLVAGVRVAGWTVLVIHGVLGVLLVPVLLAHLARRFRTPTTADWEGRRTTLQYAGLAVGGVVAWRVTWALGRLLDSADRRATGSRAAAGTGNSFPETSWVLDDPDPVDAADWQLHVVGAVDRPLALGAAELPGADEADRRRAVLDCTSGWYADREWQGVAVTDLLDRAGRSDDATWVTFHSVTGYRFGFPLDAVDDVLLATHVDGERLTHGHGFPLRVVAPGRRGFQWVKWVTAVEVRRREDWGRWVSIFTSWLG